MSPAFRRIDPETLVSSSAGEVPAARLELPAATLELPAAAVGASCIGDARGETAPRAKNLELGVRGGDGGGEEGPSAKYLEFVLSMGAGGEGGGESGAAGHAAGANT